MEYMNLFGSVKHNDDNTDVILPELAQNSSDKNAMLDYLVLTTIRNIQDESVMNGGYYSSLIRSEKTGGWADYDFAIINEKYYSGVKAMLGKIAHKLVDMGVITSYIIKDSITEESSGGIDMFDSDHRNVLGIDVLLCNVLYGSTDFQFRIGEDYSFQVERLLADKLVAILSQRKFRRTKDLYDFYTLTAHFDFDFEELLYCVNQQDNYDASMWDNIPVSEEALQEYQKIWEELKLVSYDSNTILSKPKFNDVIEQLNLVSFTAKTIKSGPTFWDHKSLLLRGQGESGSINSDEYVRKLSVICGPCAIGRRGLAYVNCGHLDLWTEYEEINNVDSAIIRYLYNSNIDYTYEVFPEPTNPNLLLPSKERTIVECIRFLDYIDEGLLIEALQNYLQYFWSDHIYEVADHFGVPRKSIDYWFDEAREESDMSMG